MHQYMAARDLVLARRHPHQCLSPLQEPYRVSLATFHQVDYIFNAISALLNNI